MDEVFSLFDCNDCYVSCEYVFRPSLEGKPVIVLANNLISHSYLALGLWSW